ncbi:phage integrase SAM-like domain-containing protein [Kaistella anthropi]|nr:phage integrase SAM-like domain-containing protein [Kaistella anthropi]
MEMFSLHIAKQEKLIGLSTTAVSIAKFHQTRNHVKSFVKHKFNRSDFLLREMTMAFITEFEYYLKAEKRFQQNTVHKTLQRFKQMVKIAVGLDYLEKESFPATQEQKTKKTGCIPLNGRVKIYREPPLCIWKATTGSRYVYFLLLYWSGIFGNVYSGKETHNHWL